MLGLFKKKSTGRADSMGTLMKELKGSGVSFADSLNVCSWMLLEYQSKSFERYLRELHELQDKEEPIKLKYMKKETYLDKLVNELGVEATAERISIYIEDIMRASRRTSETDDAINFLMYLKNSILKNKEE